MATVHPSAPIFGKLGVGSYREIDVLRILEDGLPMGFDIFHNVEWSSEAIGEQQIGEIDLAVVSPAGHLLLIEVKSGAIEEGETELAKRYSARLGGSSDIGRQVRRTHSALLTRLRQESLQSVHIETLLVLPDYETRSSTVSFGRERIVDATEMDELCQRVQQSLVHQPALSDELRVRLVNFLCNRFSIVLDVSSLIGKIKRTSTALATGLATWVPLVHHESNLYVIDGTAGSGKTQLALALLNRAHARKQRCAYVCYNRSLADHMVSIAPVSVQTMTFHEACVESLRRGGEEPDFTQPGVYQDLEEQFIASAADVASRWDLLVIDETQDFKPEWVEALLTMLNEGGRGYLLGDNQQQVYPRERFDIHDSVNIKCMDNFRSPTKVVEAINTLALTPEPVVSRSIYSGAAPEFHTYAPGTSNSLTVVQERVKEIVSRGFRVEQIAVLSFSGLGNSEVMAQEKLAGLWCKKPTGKYDKAGNALWSDGDLLTDTIYRFKGQSAPVVLLCEIDFEVLGNRELRKLFVGLTRAQYYVECVLSERAAELIARAG